MSDIPEYHRSVSYESSWLLILLAHNPNSSFLHTYPRCSSSVQVDTRSQEHLHNRNIYNDFVRGNISVSVKPSMSLVYVNKIHDVKTAHLGFVLTDKKVTAEGAKTRAPLSCLDICPVAACTWLTADHWVRHFGLLDLQVDFDSAA